MLALAGLSERYGYVLVDDKPVDAGALSRILGGGSSAEAEKLLAELESNGVFSRDRRGLIYCRRMVKEDRIRASSVEHGRRGGNPILKTTMTTLAAYQHESAKVGTPASAEKQTIKSDTLNPSLVIPLTIASIDSENRQSKPSLEPKTPPQKIADPAAVRAALNGAYHPTGRSPNGSRPAAPPPNSPNYDQAKVRKERWRQKIASELHKTRPTDEAVRLIAAYAAGQREGIEAFEQVDKLIKLREAATARRSQS